MYWKQCYFFSFLHFFILQQVLRGLGLTQKFALIGILYSLLLLLFSLVFLWVCNNKLQAVLLAMIVANIVVNIIILWRWKIYHYLSGKYIDKN